MKSEPSGWEVRRGATGQREVLERPRRPGAARSAGEHSNLPRGRVKSAMLRHAKSCCGIWTCEGKAMGNGGEGERERVEGKKSPLNCSVLLQTMRLEAGLIRADGICERLERISEGLISGEDKRGQASYKIPFLFKWQHMKVQLYW